MDDTICFISSHFYEPFPLSGAPLCIDVLVFEPNAISSSLHEEIMIYWSTVKPEQIMFPCSHKPPCLIKPCILTQCRMIGLCLSMSINHCCIIYRYYLFLVENKYSGLCNSILTVILPVSDTSKMHLFFFQMWICQAQLFNVPYRLFLSMFILHLFKKKNVMFSLIMDYLLMAYFFY